MASLVWQKKNEMENTFKILDQIAEQRKVIILFLLVWKQNATYIVKTRID